MGCSSSSNKNPTVEAARRRLSVGKVDKESGSEELNVAAAEEDRGLLTELSGQGLQQLLEQSQLGDQGRKFSIGSATDNNKTSFANKSVAQFGEEQGVTGIGWTCRKGLKPESPNQDSWMCLKVADKVSMYGVFDGHGQKGHDVSNFVKDNLPKLIIRDPRFAESVKSGTPCLELDSVLKDCFRKIQNIITTADSMKKLDAKLSGTTCTMGIIEHTCNKLTVAHVADSTCAIARRTGGKIEASVLTRDHKPDLADERARIEKAGGRVVFDGYANHRIYAKNARYPGLNMSRCLGDLMGHQDCGITCEPEVNSFNLTSEDHILMLCSDGVWEFIDATEAANMVGDYPYAKAQTAAETLAKSAWDRWIKEEGGAVVDDITVVLIYLQQQIAKNGG